MKTKKVNKRLVLVKEKIANLSVDNMDKARAGAAPTDLGGPACNPDSKVPTECNPPKTHTCNP